MSTDVDHELRQFHKFITLLLASSKRWMSPEEALDLWQSANPFSQEYRATVAAIQEGLDELHQGSKGMTLHEFDRDFRNRHGITSSRSNRDVEPEEYDETVAAIQEALDDPRPDVPWEVIKERFRRRHAKE
jgi:hypothetical protein